VWFPEGEVWYDYFTHEKYDGGQTLDIAKDIDEMPLYVRGGHILATQPYTPRPATAALDTLVMRVYPAAGDADNSFTLYEDDGISLGYKDGKYMTTRLQYTQTGDKATVTVHPAEGAYDGQVSHRAYRLLLPALPDGSTVKVNGRKARVGRDNDKNCPAVEIARKDINDKITVEFNI